MDKPMGIVELIANLKAENTPLTLRAAEVIETHVKVIRESVELMKALSKMDAI
jgi:hypothetical protein